MLIVGNPLDPLPTFLDRFFGSHSSFPIRGHTPESICLLVSDLRRGPEPWFVLTGDTLFGGAVGRPDLPGRVAESARELHESIHAKLLALPGELELWPAHFAGSACGAGMSGKPSSTLAFEKRWNPMLCLGREAFVAALADVPPKPAEMAQILRFNQGLSHEPRQ
jgi:hydroxyacylglutathione hydrolase